MRRETNHLCDLSFDSISGAGPNGAIVHYRASPATNRKLEPQSLYLIDSGGQYRDCTTDVTRTLAIGTPTAEMRDRFTRVLKGHIAIARAMFPKGANGAQIDSFARQALWEAGLDYDHGTGHGVGAYLSVHEGPQNISRRGSCPLEPGMIISNEPGYYKTGAYGIRIENLVLVEKREIPGAERETYGFETLTLAPIDLSCVEPKLLSRDELRWLDSYHARVRKELSPLVSPPVRKWLAQATRALARK
jgi:Xaa-Pro aminopeptidase